MAYATASTRAPFIVSYNFRTEVPNRYRQVGPASKLSNAVNMLAGVSRVSVECASEDEPVCLYYTCSHTVDGNKIFRKIVDLLKSI